MNSKGKPFIFMLSVKNQSMMAVFEVSITSSYTEMKYWILVSVHRNSVHVIFINTSHLFFYIIIYFSSSHLWLQHLVLSVLKMLKSK